MMRYYLTALLAVIWLLPVTAAAECLAPLDPLNSQDNVLSLESYMEEYKVCIYRFQSENSCEGCEEGFVHICQRGAWNKTAFRCDAEQAFSSQNDRYVPMVADRLQAYTHDSFEGNADRLSRSQERLVQQGRWNEAYDGRKWSELGAIVDGRKGAILEGQDAYVQRHMRDYYDTVAEAKAVQERRAQENAAAFMSAFGAVLSGYAALNANRGYTGGYSSGGYSSSSSGGGGCSASYKRDLQNQWNQSCSDNSSNFGCTNIRRMMAACG